MSFSPLLLTNSSSIPHALISFLTTSSQRFFPFLVFPISTLIISLSFLVTISSLNASKNHVNLSRFRPKTVISKLPLIHIHSQFYPPTLTPHTSNLTFLISAVLSPLLSRSMPNTRTRTSHIAYHYNGNGLTTSILCTRTIAFTHRVPI